MENKWTKRLKKLEGYVQDDADPFQNVIRSPSPSVNFIFGNTHGLPRGYSMLLWGPPGGGKSLLTNSIIGQLHRDDPEALVIKFDTEFRDNGQVTEETAKAFGIDKDRYIPYQVNKATQVFDRIDGEIQEMCKEGAKVGLIIIDSINGIQGRRESNSESIEQMTIGDHAQTVQIGLKKILPTQRQNKISLIVIAQQRSELDMWEVKKGNKTKAAVSHGTQHHCEYFVHVEKNTTKAGRTDALDKTFEDNSKKDLTDSADQTGHKVKVWMQKSSFGGAGRSAEFTLDYKRGIINQHEEVFALGNRWGIIERPNARTYIVNGKSFGSKADCLKGLEKSVELQKFVVAGLMAAENRIAKEIADAEEAETVEEGFGEDA